MAYKFGRNYELTIWGPDYYATVSNDGITTPYLATPPSLTIKLPFTVEFDITRTIIGTSPNSASIQIYNLNRINRDQIEFNVWQQQIFQKILFKAGYGNSLATLLSGNITQAWSVRQGTDFVTTVECFDGGWAYNNAFSTVEIGTGSNKDVIKKLIDSLSPTIKSGVISDTVTPDSTSRGKSYNSYTAPLLNKLTNKCFFIDNEVANVLAPNECLEGDLDVIDDSIGILDTPIRQNSFVYVDLLFEPRIKPGQKITLNSNLAPQFNGDYKVGSVKHRGTISEAVCGDARTSVSLYLGGVGVGELRVIK